ncbi:MAG: T9SS type A sorting domain-containing protein [Taibaiella sp.]|jgi:hypothetical protein
MKKNSTRNWLKAFALSAFTLFAGTASFAQAPSNDECTGAIMLPVNTTGVCSQTAGTTIAATTSAQSMPCATNSNPDVWYTFTALNTQQTITLSSFSSSAFADVGVYSGFCPSGLTLLSCTPTAGTVTATGLTVGTTYYLRVRTPAQNFNVCVGAPVPPLANDECAGAISVPVNSDTTCTQQVAATMVGSSPSTNAMTCFPTGAWSDVWFSFTAGSTVHRISVPPFTSSNSTMVVYGGSCSGLTQVYCGTTNALVNGLTAGTTYYVRINSSLSNSTFNICITTPILLANDECAGAIPVPVNSDTACTQTVAGTSADATPSTNAMTCFPVGFYGDVWYSFVAGAANHKISTINTAAALAVYSGSCGTLTEVHCGTAGDTLSNLIAGNTYYARLIIPTSTSFDICITTVPPPAPNNDECAGAIMAPVNAGTTCAQTVASSTIGKTESSVSMSCSSTPNTPDVWYTFTATNTQHTITLSDFTNSIQTADIAVYSGSCGALTQLSCTSATTTSTVSGLTVGTTYYLLVRITYQDFTVCITTPVNLPVSLSELKGHISNGKAILNWNTYSEHANKGFDIMRSEDGKTFRSVGWIPSQAANGNSEALLVYTFTDAQAVTGKTFYQLKQVDLDGKTALSNIISLAPGQNDEQTVMRAYPNPAKNMLYVDITGTVAGGNIMITDMMGKTLINHAATSNTETIDLGALPAGIYFVKYTNSTTSAIQKIVKK